MPTRHAFAAAVLCAGLAPALAQPQEPQDRLPATPDALVVELEWVGGYGPPRRDEPMLRIFADGRVRVQAMAADAEPVESRIDLPRLRRLLDELVLDRRLLDYDGEAVKAQMRAIDEKTGLGHGIEDAATLRLTVTTRQRSHRIEVEAPDHFARIYVDVKALSEVAAAERTLARLAGEISLGGPTQIERLCRAANAELHAKMPARAPLTPVDFTDGERIRGGVIAHFHRVDKMADGSRQSLRARVTDGAQGSVALVWVSPTGR